MVARIAPKASTTSIISATSSSEEEKTQQRLSISPHLQVNSVFFDLENSSFHSSSDALDPLFTSSSSPTRPLSKRSFESLQDLEDYIMARDVSSRSSSVPSSPSSSSPPSKSSLLSLPSLPSLSSLSSISSLSSLSLHAGMLDLELKDGRSWKRRLWVLREDGLLGFYSSSLWRRIGGVSFKVALNLRDVKEIFHDEECFLLGESCFMLNTTKGRSFSFKAGSREEMLEWMVVLARQKNILSSTSLAS